MAQSRLIKDRKSQVWTTDFLIGSVILLIVMVVFFLQLGVFEQPAAKLPGLMQESAAISSALIGTGYPAGWANATVVRLGLTTLPYRIDAAKLAAAAAMDYGRLRQLLQSQPDIYFFLVNRTGCIIPVNGVYGIGSPESTIDINSTCVTQQSISIDTKDLVQITRLVIYNGKPAKLVLYTWT
ncbi:hypothetical protein HY642_04605 [Candidatus Woesearchaeota archaeon]|nr:hypothetical protein [Candidatus Woesearchaeota archaeon]